MDIEKRESWNHGAICAHLVVNITVLLFFCKLTHSIWPHALPKLWLPHLGPCWKWGTRFLFIPLPSSSGWRAAPEHGPVSVCCFLAVPGRALSSLYVRPVLAPLCQQPCAPELLEGCREVPLLRASTFLCFIPVPRLMNQLLGYSLCLLHPLTLYRQSRTCLKNRNCSAPPAGRESWCFSGSSNPLLFCLFVSWGCSVSIRACVGEHRAHLDVLPSGCTCVCSCHGPSWNRACYPCLHCGCWDERSDGRAFPGTIADCVRRMLAGETLGFSGVSTGCCYCLWFFLPLCFNTA